MKLLFIENRYKTYFFEHVARKLRSEGHDIYWIIQNKGFSPSKSFNNYFIDYPKKRFNYKILSFLQFSMVNSSWKAVDSPNTKSGFIELSSVLILVS